MPDSKLRHPDVLDSISKDRLQDYVEVIRNRRAAAQQWRSVEWEGKHARNWRLYRNIPKHRQVDWPWPGAANYFIPVVSTAIDALSALMFGTIFSSRPMVVGEGIQDEETARLATKVLFSFVFEQWAPLDLLADDWDRDTAVDGTSVAIPVWDRTESLIREEVPIIGRPRQEIIREDSGREIALQQPFEIRRIEEKARYVRADRLRVEHTDLSRLYVSPNSGPDLQYPECPWYYEVKFVDIEDLMQMRRAGYRGIDDDLLQQLREEDPTPREEVEAPHQGVGYDRQRTLPVEVYFSREVLPAEYDDDTGERQTQRFMDEDGIPEETVTWYFPDTDTIARMEPLTRFRPDGLRPHVDRRFTRNARSFYGVGLAEKLWMLQKLVNTNFNMQVNYGAITTLPMFFYEPHMTGVLPALNAVRPGEGIPVNNARGVQPFRFNTDTAHFQQLFVNAQHWIERVSHVTDPAAGRSSQLPQQQRTARGLMQLLGQSNQMFGYAAQVQTRYWKRLFQQAVHVMRSFSPGTLQARFLENEGGSSILSKISIPTEVFRGEIDFDFELSPDEALGQQKAQNFFALMMQLPQIQQNPAAMRELARDVAVSFGKGDKFDKLFPADQIVLPGGNPAGPPGAGAPGAGDAGAGALIPFPGQEGFGQNLSAPAGAQNAAVAGGPGQ